MSLYFALSGVFSVLAYFFVKTFRDEVKVFVVTYFAISWGAFGFLETGSVFLGNPGNPLWMIMVWRTWWMPFTILGITLYSLVPAIFSVLIYEIYKYATKLMTGKETIASKEEKDNYEK